MTVATTPKPPPGQAAGTQSSPAAPVRRPYRISVDLFERMAAAGLFDSRSRIILWKGELFETMTKNPPHVTASLKCIRLLPAVIPGGWHARPDAPVAIGDQSMPEPDFTIVRGRVEEFGSRHPTSNEVGIVIEISDSSLAADRGEMLEAYARESIPVYWIVNLIDRRIEVYTDPSGPITGPAVYRSSRSYAPGERVPVVLDGREVGQIAVDDALP